MGRKSETRRNEKNHLRLEQKSPNHEGIAINFIVKIK